MSATRKLLRQHSADATAWEVREDVRGVELEFMLHVNDVHISLPCAPIIHSGGAGDARVPFADALVNFVLLVGRV